MAKVTRCCTSASDVVFGVLLLLLSLPPPAAGEITYPDTTLFRKYTCKNSDIGEQTGGGFYDHCTRPNQEIDKPPFTT